VIPEVLHREQGSTKGLNTPHRPIAIRRSNHCRRRSSLKVSHWLLDLSDSLFAVASHKTAGASGGAEGVGLRGIDEA